MPEGASPLQAQGTGGCQFDSTIDCLLLFVDPLPSLQKAFVIANLLVILLHKQGKARKERRERGTLGEGKVWMETDQRKYSWLVHTPVALLSCVGWSQSLLYVGQVLRVGKRATAAEDERRWGCCSGGDDACKRWAIPPGGDERAVASQKVCVSVCWGGSVRAVLCRTRDRRLLRAGLYVCGEALFWPASAPSIRREQLNVLWVRVRASTKGQKGRAKVGKGFEAAFWPGRHLAAVIVVCHGGVKRGRTARQSQEGARPGGARRATASPPRHIGDAMPSAAKSG